MMLLAPCNAAPAARKTAPGTSLAANPRHHDRNDTKAPQGETSVFMEKAINNSKKQCLVNATSLNRSKFQASFTPQKHN
jgi:hypothetical protein